MTNKTHTDMIYSAHADTRIEIGNWPQFFKSVFHVYAKSESDAKKRAEVVMKSANVTYENLRVEFIGRRYEVLSNEEFSVAGIQYRADSVGEIRIYDGTMQIGIDSIRNGKQDHDSIAVWCRPADFKEAAERVFSKMKYKEI